ncbi:hypothetical protein DKW60_13480 [Leucothrix pacifica]|uniref:Uncharacterized protein n=1 Tax=Leucothrix pacifica TaxID=1247513 RepID=A0A317CCE9_9GAMM|nr:hypothetical protein DKW60_13480 [Leucothrix pacifica]
MAIIANLVTVFIIISLNFKSFNIINLIKSYFVVLLSLKAQGVLKKVHFLLRKIKILWNLRAKEFVERSLLSRGERF